MEATSSWSLGSYHAWETVPTRSSNCTPSLALWVPAEPNMQNDCVLSQPVSLHHILLCWFRSPFLIQSLNWFAQLSFPARGDFSLCVQMSHKHCLHLRLPGLNSLGPQLASLCYLLAIPCKMNTCSGYFMRFLITFTLLHLYSHLKSINTEPKVEVW